MEAPKCLKCGTRHWSRQTCPADEGKVTKPAPAPKSVAPPPAKPTPTPAKKVGGFDRVVYQREYMRRYRARDKGA
jgi:hypothetical protein